MDKKKPNRLKDALSPYLQQHAFNPVDWYEWGEDAFNKAESENKLILISIGYSACHWCHVMAHESFENEEVAQLMNKHFVCIKVDREELPDVDLIYMDACRLISGHGGWPLNAIALPDKRPIHALTYAPKEHWLRILNSVNDLWLNDHEQAFEYAEKLHHGVKNMSLPPEFNVGQKPVSGINKKAFENIKSMYDPVYGGLKRAPKFPMPHIWRSLLDYSVIYNENEAAEIALDTLKHMSLGGIYDFVGGGFARYSVDEKWFAPHFEKMLYDNAQLISVFSQAFAISGNIYYKHITERSINFCSADLLNSEGLFTSALDADSEGNEGFYYTYLFEELEKILKIDIAIFSKYFQCRPEGNWEHGRNILFAIDTEEKAAKDLNIESKKLHEILNNCLEKLKTFRNGRIAPGTDDKCICSWNMLMLKALAEASVYCNNKTYLKQAIDLADSAIRHFIHDGELFRIYKNGELKNKAYLEDYATCIDALIFIYKANPDEKYLILAKQLCEYCLYEFYDAEKGFFRFVQKNKEILSIAAYQTADDVISSGNSIMAQNLYLLSWYFDRDDWKVISLRMLYSMKDQIENSAAWYANWLRFSLMSENDLVQYIICSDNIETYHSFLQKNKLNTNYIFGFVTQSTEIPLFKGKEYKGEDLLFTCIEKTCGLPEEI